MILGLETSCDETAAAVITEDGEILSNVVASQTELHAVYGGVVPEIASRRHLELVSPVVREALDLAGAGLDDLDRIAVTRGPGLIGALLVGLAAAKGLAWGRGLPLVAGRPPARSRRLALPPADRPRAAVPLPARERRSHAAPRRAGSQGVHRDRHHARRRGRRGIRQGRAAARARLSRRRGDRPRRPRRRPHAYDFPVAHVPGLDFSFSGVKTALLYAVRDHRTSMPAAPTSPPRTSARSSGRSSNASARLRTDGGSRSSAASPPTPSSAPRCPRRLLRRSRSARTMPR